MIRSTLMENGFFVKQTDLSHVEIYRTKQFTFRPAGLQSSTSAFNVHSSRVPISSANESTRTSVWNCDGEVIQDSDISIRYVWFSFQPLYGPQYRLSTINVLLVVAQFRSHRGLITVYRRGLFSPQNDDGTSEPSCCCQPAMLVKLSQFRNANTKHQKLQCSCARRGHRQSFK